ncbi:Wzz/FepE/Etk N-terminal domain-containing protein [Paenibacillus sp. HB172176]|uniref:YveK family protein n=1 Tax=Paenibacillus sp. HB172176 TaxID=2493690 RepID=UPI0014393C21|nr:Wzz/FepE/Etk N-terminal domain-containing protein [Paenibacillus sp. HB172176]
MENKRFGESGEKRFNEKLTVMGEKEINVKAIFQIIKKRLWLILLITVILTILGDLYNSRPEPQVYAASTRIMIAVNNDMMVTAKAMVREPIVINQVIDNLKLNLSVGQVRSMMRVDSVDTSLITVITVIDSNPNRAADIANETVNVYRNVAADMLNIQGIRLLTAATPDPNSINTTSNTIVYIAFVLGLIIGISLTFLLESLDDSIRNEHDVEQLLGMNMLGAVSRMKRRHITPKLKKSKAAVIRGESIGS